MCEFQGGPSLGAGTICPRSTLELIALAVLVLAFLICQHA